MTSERMRAKMTNLHRLEDTPENTWGNTILYRLAEALDYPKEVRGGDVNNPQWSIVADPDEVLEEALKYVRLSAEKEAQ